MQRSEFYKYIDHPELLKAEHVKELKELTEAFPYFQSAHILLSLAAHRWDSTIYQQSLKRTAITVPDRTQLFELLHAPVKSEVEIAERKTVDTKLEIKAPEVQQILPANEAQGEMDVLRAAELATAESAENTTAEPEKTPEKIMHEEIARQVVASYVEKEVIKTPELHKPQPVPQDTPESFSDWLAFLKKNNGQPYDEIEKEVNKEKAKQQARKEAESAPQAPTDNRKKKNLEIIDKIIEKNPGLIRTREDQKFFTPEIKAKESLLENEHLMTETLARIYALQGNTGKAIRAYQILSLKYPQKSAYFASLIQELKSTNKNQ